MASARRIDVHFHAIHIEYRAAAVAARAAPVQGTFPEWSPEHALSFMDANGIQARIMSATYPGGRFCTNAADARMIARAFNEYNAGVIARHRDYKTTT